MPTIMLSDELKKKLDKKKIIPRETYENVIQRMYDKLYTPRQSEVFPKVKILPSGESQSSRDEAERDTCAKAERGTANDSTFPPPLSSIFVDRRES